MEEKRDNLVRNKKDIGELMIRIDQSRDQIQEQLLIIQKIEMESQILKIKKDQLLSIDKIVQLFDILKK